MKWLIIVVILLSFSGISSCSEQEGSKPSDSRDGGPAAVITVEQEISVGKPVVVDGLSPVTRFAVVFEDDGDTGYFYGLDTTRKDNRILDALHIYDVKGVTDGDVPSVVQIMWSTDGLKSALLINKYPHAIFDFEAKRAYCRTAFPPPIESWSAEGHEWDDKALGLFK